MGDVKNGGDRVAMWDQEICKSESLAGTSLFEREEGSPNSIMDHHKRSPRLYPLSTPAPSLRANSTLTPVVHTIP